jgi:enamine deaminase RidA (YjgF/YER057c/UK114 family)
MQAIRSVALILAAACLFGACEEQAAAPQPKSRIKELYHLNKFEEAFGYAQAVRVEDTLYISGSVAVDADGKLIGPDDMALQLRAAYENVGRTLKAFKTDFDHVAKETIYTTDMEALLRESKLRFEFYDRQNLPASTWVEVKRLVDPGFLVAIDVTVELP